MQKYLYHLLIFVVIIFKLGFLISTLAFKYLKQTESLDEKTLKIMEDIRDQFLTVSEVLMYIVLIIVFSPHRKSVDIKLSREEQIIAFAIGILGIFNTNWETFKKLFSYGRKEVSEVMNHL